MELGNEEKPVWVPGKEQGLKCFKTRLPEVKW
jgi:hypothetical protein